VYCYEPAARADAAGPACGITEPPQALALGTNKTPRAKRIGTNTTPRASVRRTPLAQLAAALNRRKP
jgi:hypothetical protein